MPDKITNRQRSNNMRAIKGKDTSLELQVRKWLWNNGYHYRKNVKGLPGTPDIVLSKYRTVIFVNGCFWHHHFRCRLAVIPKTRVEYWTNKINRNVENDIRNQRLLEQDDWLVITVWECELKEAFEYRMTDVKYQLDERLKELSCDTDIFEEEEEEEW